MVANMVTAQVLIEIIWLIYSSWIIYFIIIELSITLGYQAWNVVHKNLSKVEKRPRYIMKSKLSIKKLE